LLRSTVAGMYRALNIDEVFTSCCASLARQRRVPWRRPRADPRLGGRADVWKFGRLLRWLCRDLVARCPGGLQDRAAAYADRSGREQPVQQAVVDRVREQYQRRKFNRRNFDYLGRYYWARV